MEFRSKYPQNILNQGIPFEFLQEIPKELKSIVATYIMIATPEDLIVLCSLVPEEKDFDKVVSKSILAIHNQNLSRLVFQENPNSLSSVLNHGNKRYHSNEYEDAVINDTLTLIYLPENTEEEIKKKLDDTLAFGYYPTLRHLYLKYSMNCVSHSVYMEAINYLDYDVAVMILEETKKTHNERVLKDIQHLQYLRSTNANSRS